MTTSLHFRVVGTPAPQGSKQAFVRGGRAVMREMSTRVRPWRDSVTTAALDAALAGQWTTPQACSAVIRFVFLRPKHHYGTGRNVNVLKATAPTWHRGKPDLDKLLRSTFDALTASGVITDDASIAEVVASKRYADPGQPAGASIEIHPTN